MVRRVDLTTGLITTAAGFYNAFGIQFGQPIPPVDGIPATAAALGYPQGIALDSAGNLYISDNYNSRIRRVDANTGLISTYAGSGVGDGFGGGSNIGFAGDGSAATAADLDGPYGLEELQRHVLVRGIVIGEANCHFQHVEAEFRHPCCAVGLLEYAPARQCGRTVERPDVVEPEEASLEDVVTEGVLAVDPPSEADQQLVKCARQELEVLAAVDVEDRQCGPRLDGRVRVAEVPFVGRQLPVWMHVPLSI